MADNTEVQKAASMQNIIDDHMAGVSGYAIAEKYDMDTEKVRLLIQEANDSGKFIPTSAGGEQYTSQHDRVVALEEGKNPEVEVETTKK